MTDHSVKTVGNVNTGAYPRQMVAPGQYWANSYVNNAFLDGDDSFMGIGPMGGASFVNGQDSVFNQGIYPGSFGGQMPNVGFGGGFGGYGYGYGPGREVMNMTQAEYLKYQGDLEDQMIDRQVHRQHKSEGAEFQMGSRDDFLTRQIGILQRTVKENEQDHVIKEYNRLLDATKRKLEETGALRGGKVTWGQVKAYAEREYFEATGKSLADDLTENGSSGFSQGLKKGLFGIGWLFANKDTYQDNIEKIYGEKRSKSDKVWEYVGMGISGLLTGGLALLGGAKLIKAIRP